MVCSFTSRMEFATARSQIFLRLIKTIIAPLLFATLVVGIAGHSNLKQVGRMGLKAIIYFEVVTTIALFIGLAVVVSVGIIVWLLRLKSGAHGPHLLAAFGPGFSAYFLAVEL